MKCSGQLFLVKVLFISVVASDIERGDSTTTTLDDSWTPSGESLGGDNDGSRRICDRVSIWKWDQFQSYRNCSVIEGSLQINILFESWENVDVDSYGFPVLTEVTGFLMLFSTKGILSLRQLFPRLALIRGLELVENYALVISKMHDLQDIGLSSLVRILNGGVWIVGNENLCYVDSVRWAFILGDEMDEAHHPHDIVIRRNRGCSDVCSNQCPKQSVFDKSFCWDGQPSSCQLFTKVCTRVQEGDESSCFDRCPSESPYEYLGRRCLTRDECLQTMSKAPELHEESYLVGKLFESGEVLRCVLEWAPGFSLHNNATECVPCPHDVCPKDCPGGTVDTIETARSLAGCTRILGELRIQIGTPLLEEGTVVGILRDTLGGIEIIEDYLSISNTFSFYSLDFLQSLKVIRGRRLGGKVHALLVTSNENLVDLWSSSNVTIENKEARVLFHYNSKLCPGKIYDFLARAGLDPGLSSNPMDIGITNGDKVTCHTKSLAIRVASAGTTWVEVEWENFALSLANPNYLLNYEVHYKRSDAPPEKETKVSFRDPCGRDEWRVWEKSPSERESESEKESFVLGNLEPGAGYALYVKAVVLPSTLYPINNDTGAESEVVGFQTQPGVPDKVADLRLRLEEDGGIRVSWSPPNKTNGPLTFFRVFLKESHVGRNSGAAYTCSKGPPKPKMPSQHEVTTSTLGPLVSSTTPPSSSSRLSDEEKYEALGEERVLNVILGNHLFTPPKPQRLRKKRSLEEEEDVCVDSQGLCFGVPDLRFQIPVALPILASYVQDIRNLSHYTSYDVGVSACREDSSVIGVVCSKMQWDWIRTPPSPSADTVGNISLNIDSSSSVLEVRWEEPPAPNGGIWVYLVSLQRVSKKGKEEEACVSYEDFTGVLFIPLDDFPSGNYSVSIQAISHAQTETLSSVSYTVSPPNYIFLNIPQEEVIEDTSSSSPSWILLGVMCLLFGVTCVGAFIFWRRQRKLKVSRRRRIVASANPTYTSPVSIPPEWELPREDLTLGKVVGKGHFGTVLNGRWRQKKDELEARMSVKFLSRLSIFLGRTKIQKKTTPDIPCAVKELRMPSNSSGQDLELKTRELGEILREALLMTKLVSPHVVKLYGIVSLSQPVLLIMEFMDRGDLRSYLISLRPPNWDSLETEEDPLLLPVLPMECLVRMAAQIADGLAYIHSKGLVHRDVAARNCLVNEALDVKVGDFGLSRETSDYYVAKRPGQFPVRWMAPESLADNAFSPQSDVWSFGVLLWEMMTLGRVPYSELLVQNDVFSHVCTGRRTLTMPPWTPTILAEVGGLCWRYKRHDRPSCTEIIERLLPETGPWDAFERISYYHNQRLSSNPDPIMPSKDSNDLNLLPLVPAVILSMMEEGDEVDKEED